MVCFDGVVKKPEGLSSFRLSVSAENGHVSSHVLIERPPCNVQLSEGERAEKVCYPEIGFARNQSSPPACSSSTIVRPTVIMSATAATVSGLNLTSPLGDRVQK